MIYDLALSDFVAGAPLERCHLSFHPVPGAVSGVAYWVTLPGMPDLEEAAWIRGIQPLPVRRVEVA